MSGNNNDLWRFFVRVVLFLHRKIQQYLRKAKDSYFTSYCMDYKSKGLNNFVLLNSLKGISIPDGVIKSYLEHSFDILGSGWKCMDHGAEISGFHGYKYQMSIAPDVDYLGVWLEGRINEKNVAESKNIWKNITHDYFPIDWHIDYKSGYRWQEKEWYKSIVFGNVPGVDVKMPWELSRMHHLPQIALFFSNFEELSQEKKRLKVEFENQVLDFISTNPPRFGVNWFCAMDVAIRASNWLLAYDIFCSAGADFSTDFKRIFERSIYEHGNHIIKNLEWNNKGRGNHYLTDICGLAFIVGYLPQTDETDAWLVLVIQELVSEVQFQFNSDGSNFEGSIAYHRLVTEMVIYATAIILGVLDKRLEQLSREVKKVPKTGFGKPKVTANRLALYTIDEAEEGKIITPFPKSYFASIELMIEFVLGVMKPDQRLPQIGDNDSGRFFKLSSRYLKYSNLEMQSKFENIMTGSSPSEETYYLEDGLECTHLIAAAKGLFKGNANLDNYELDSINCVDRVCIQQLARYKKIPSQLGPYVRAGNKLEVSCSEKEFMALTANLDSNYSGHKRTSVFDFTKSINVDQLNLASYQDFGVYVFRSDDFYLLVRCWEGDHPLVTGHMHNDQLSVELVIEGSNVISDPGTYIYSSLPGERNKYRSCLAHYSPIEYDDLASLNELDVFTFSELHSAKVNYFGKRGFWGELEVNGRKVELVCSITCDKLVINHIAEEPLSSISSQDIRYSFGYGWKESGINKTEM